MMVVVTNSTQVGLLDVDICGPSVPRMLGLTGREVHQSSSGWSPVWVTDGLGVMSIGFMLPQQDNAVIWRGPKKNGLIKQFLTVRGGLAPRKKLGRALIPTAVRWRGGQGGGGGAGGRVCAMYLRSRNASREDYNYFSGAHACLSA